VKPEVNNDGDWKLIKGESGGEKVEVRRLIHWEAEK